VKRDIHVELQDLKTFAGTLTGEVVLPEDPSYDSLRGTKYRLAHPAVIARPRTTDDIAAAISFATRHGLTLAVRSGGHGMTGLATNDGGMVIDMGHFDAVEVLDAERRLVRIGAGAQWGNAAHALGQHGLSLSSGDTVSVGVGGLTLGGGVGWMVRKYGLTIDSLVAAELVTANGDVVRASGDEHPDLFWALRGGGGNFGVVTAFEFVAQPVTTVVGGMISYDVAERASVTKRWVDVMRSAPDELNSTLVLFPGFGPQMAAQVMVYVCYTGEDDAAAEAAIQPLRELGVVTMQDVRRKPYHEMLEEAPTPPGFRAIATSGFIQTFDDAAIDMIAANYGQSGQPILQFRSLGGAFARVQPDATAFAHRGAEALYWAATIVPADVPAAVVEQKRLETDAPLKPLAHGAYINFLSDASAESVAAAYPPATYARLAQVKATYDPDNVFDQNLNVKPAVSEAL
jgi:FAD/FMN-containing dehydrogenase